MNTHKSIHTFQVSTESLIVVASTGFHSVTIENPSSFNIDLLDANNVSIPIKPYQAKEISSGGIGIVLGNDFLIKNSENGTVEITYERIEKL